MSIEAMTWALNADVGDATRKLVLIGYANHAHKDGRNAWASKSTVAEYVNCSDKTVGRHVKALIAEGWIRHGDQTQVAHLRADRRPVVYDLAMTEAIRAAWKAAAADAAAGDVDPGRGDNLTPRDEERGDNLSPRESGHGGTHGGTPVSERGDTAMSHKPFRTQELPPDPPASGGTTSTISTGCQKPGPRPHTNCRGCGTTNRQRVDVEREATAQQRRAADQAWIQEQRTKAPAAPPPAYRAARAAKKAGHR